MRAFSFNRPPATATAWQAYMGCVRGTSHAGRGDPLQDRGRVASSHDRMRVAAVVCDGAGSARHADDGAEAFCNAVVTLMLSPAFDLRLSDNLLIEQVGQLRSTVLAQLERGESKPTDFNCTLSAILLSGHEVVALQIGDSPIALCQPTGHVVMPGERGEYANESYFIACEDWQSHLSLRRFDASATDALLLMSDGAGDIFLRDSAVYEPTVVPLLRNMARDDVMSFSLLDRVLADQRTHSLTDDDKCLVALVRKSSAKQKPARVDLAAHAGWLRK